jgi:hypothetical protein
MRYLALLNVYLYFREPLVVLGFVIAQIVGILFGTVSVVNMVPLFAMQFVLITLLLIGYRKA